MIPDQDDLGALDETLQLFQEGDESLSVLKLSGLVLDSLGGQKVHKTVKFRRRRESLPRSRVKKRSALTVPAITSIVYRVGFWLPSSLGP
jgi:hypothetical protein